MSALHDRPPGVGQRGLPGLEHDRLWSRLPDRSGDPLDSADGCRSCAGTGTDLTADPPCSCGTCAGSGWAP